jgi:PAT family beta-lactamase induction signal transducer AmpG
VKNIFIELINNFAKLLINRNLLHIFILGIASAIPLILTLSTLSIWLMELSISKATIGLFALTSLPYSIKFLWSPLIDGIKIPYFYKKLGVRKSWLIILQLALSLSITMLALSNPSKYLYITALATLVVAFLSASQDIVIDAYRIDLLSKEEQGIGATMLVYGYRIGMLVAGAGALILSNYFDFMQIYLAFALLYLLFASYSLSLPKTFDSKDLAIKHNFANWVQIYVFDPLVNFMHKPNYLIILIFIILFKLGDAFAGIMTNPFLLELGFSKLDLAFYVKTVGFFATIFGSLIGGIICLKYQMKHNLLFAAIIQMLTNLIFCLQAIIGDNNLMLAFTIGAENLAGGVGTIVFVAYLSNLCNIKYSATQYALLSSLAAVSRSWLSASSGWFAEYFSWVDFFIFSTLISLPAIIMIIYLFNIKKQN